jgi:hypothetical protein
MSAVSKKLMPASIDVLICTIGLGLADGADGLEEPFAAPDCHGSEAEFRDQETCMTKRCVFHDVPFY